MQLTTETVNDLAKDCLFGKDEPHDKAILIKGIINNWCFNPEKIALHTEIIALLTELPDAFHADKGGGWSFLNMCNDRHGRQWTGFQLTMEALFCLGMAIGKI